MKFIFLLILMSSVLCSNSFAQKRKKNKDNVPGLEELGLTTELSLKISGDLACKCIDSVYNNDKSVKANDPAILNCIDKQVGTYEMSKQLMESLKSKNKKINIYVSQKDSKAYRQYYYDLESWLKDSCKKLNFILTNDDDAVDNSYSKNIYALKEYDKGIPYLKKNEFEKALPFFEEAVKIDSVFSFAWDNIGVCNRNLGNYDKAIEAYNESLKVDPKGHTPLQNIGVVYTYQKKYPEAIAAYKKMLTVYPNDAEGYYGIGNIYIMNLRNDEEGLDYICKAYNLYVKEKSPYRADAEKLINIVYAQMKKDKKEAEFHKILKNNNISPN